MQKKSSSKKKEELLILDPTIISISEQLLENLSPQKFEIKENFNRKSLVISDKELNEYLNINTKLAKIKDVKNARIYFLDNDSFEVEIDLETFNKKSILKYTIKIEKALIDSKEAYFAFSFDEYQNPKIEILEKILSILNKNFMQKFFLPIIIKQFEAESIYTKKNMVTVDLKEGLLKNFYKKTINQIFTMNIPYFGNKHITDMFQIESIMCEKGQIWIELLYKIT